MKREGRQHGMVRNYKGNLNSKSITRINRFETPPTAGLFTKVSSKPTNHSKFTGKCGKSKCFECHSHPSCKSKDKGKGTYKIRSTDVATNHRLISWKVVDSKGNHGLNYVGLSSDQVLGQLSNYYYQNNYDDDDQDYYDDEEDEDVGDHYGDGEDLHHHHGYDVDVHDGSSFGLGDELVMGSCHVVDDLIINVSNDMDDVGDGAIDDVKDVDGTNDDEEDDMGFCDVGFVIEQVDGDVDEGWCLVDEM